MIKSTPEAQPNIINQPAHLTLCIQNPIVQLYKTHPDYVESFNFYCIPSGFPKNWKIILTRIQQNVQTFEEETTTISLVYGRGEEWVLGCEEVEIVYTYAHDENIEDKDSPGQIVGLQIRYDQLAGLFALLPSKANFQHYTHRVVWIGTEREGESNCTLYDIVKTLVQTQRTVKTGSTKVPLNVRNQ